MGGGRSIVAKNLGAKVPGLLIASVALLGVCVGCAGLSPSDSGAPTVSLRQAVCERDGGVWRANGRCDIQSTSR